jgi:Arc/MetJ-type ribon-helix-helix transcriptional regulator
VKTLTVRLPEPLASEIEAESRRRSISKSDVVRERLERARDTARPGAASLDAIHYLRATGYGRKRPR